MRYGRIGRCRSAGPALRFSSTRRSIATSRSAASRPTSKVRIREIAETRARYDYRRVLCCCAVRAGLSIRSKSIVLTRRWAFGSGPRHRVKAKLREDRTDATHSHQIWAWDFVHDQLATGRKIRVLTASLPSRASRRWWIHWLRRQGQIGEGDQLESCGRTSHGLAEIRLIDAFRQLLQECLKDNLHVLRHALNPISQI